MKRLYFIIILLVVFSLSGFSKGKWTIDLGSSYGFNSSDIYLWNYKMENTSSVGLYAGLGYEFFLWEKLSLGSGLQYHQMHDKVNINKEEISGYSYHFNIPFHLNYYWKNLQLFSGVAVQNYRNIEDMALKRSHNVRWQFDAGMAWHFDEVWAVKASYTQLMSKKVSTFLAQNYFHHIRLGVVFNLSEFIKGINENKKK